jgi:chaperonin GroEL (HSP60 family)
VALIRCIKALEKLTGANEDQNFGIKILARAIEEPLRQIAANAGHEGAIIVEKVRANSDPDFGFNADTEVYENLVKAGALDWTGETRATMFHRLEVVVASASSAQKDRASGQVSMFDSMDFGAPPQAVATSTVAIEGRSSI